MNKSALLLLLVIGLLVSIETTNAEVKWGWTGDRRRWDQKKMHNVKDFLKQFQQVRDIDLEF
uniref:Uncharacterized protein n=1 Tax=Ciona intestinalis TaxID=7719 RepID=F6PVZ7_CIOIN